MNIKLTKSNLKDTIKLEAYLREHRDASNFEETLYCYNSILSNDFLRKFRNEFIKMSERNWKDIDKDWFKDERDLNFF